MDESYMDARGRGQEWPRVRRAAGPVVESTAADDVDVVPAGMAGTAVQTPPADTPADVESRTGGRAGMADVMARGAPAGAGPPRANRRRLTKAEKIAKLAELHARSPLSLPQQQVRIHRVV